MFYLVLFHFWRFLATHFFQGFFTWFILRPLSVWFFTHFCPSSGQVPLFGSFLFFGYPFCWFMFAWELTNRTFRIFSVEIQRLLVSDFLIFSSFTLKKSIYPSMVFWIFCLFRLLARCVWTSDHLFQHLFPCPSGWDGYLVLFSLPVPNLFSFLLFLY